MKKEIFTYGKKITAITSAFLILTASGCGKKAPDIPADSGSTVNESVESASMQGTSDTNNSGDAR